jgi:hypothetical protein
MSWISNSDLRQRGAGAEKIVTAPQHWFFCCGWNWLHPSSSANPSSWYKFICHTEREKHRLNMELDLQIYLGFMCTAVLIGSFRLKYESALVSKERRHLSVTRSERESSHYSFANLCRKVGRGGGVGANTNKSVNAWCFLIFCVTVYGKSKNMDQEYDAFLLV